MKSIGREPQLASSVPDLSVAFETGGNHFRRQVSAWRLKLANVGLPRYGILP
jgi:hypothetical protein